ncbi:MAG: hypothetical protein KKB50_14330 [Planctomycetes bacterium]|nr:hypothetical protein [Planctomycetota bacterium]
MSTSEAENLTALAQVFLSPRNSTHRQYEALRAYYVDALSSAEAARRFGYTPGSFRVLCHQFRQHPERPFFLPPPKGPGPSTEKTAIRDRIVALRKQNLSVYDIRDALAEQGHRRSPAAIALILRQEGFPRLPRRRDEERPDRPRPNRAQVADVRTLDLSPRHFRTRFGGLFLFLPDLARLGFDRVVRQAQLPGSEMIPAAHAVRSLLALKLYGRARHSHFMSDVLDAGLGLFAGLNVIPKRAFLTEYSCRIDPSSYPTLMQSWFEALTRLGLERGTSFDLDFHTIPFHGDDALMEKHYLTQRSRRQKGVLAFLAEDADRRVFCYANAELRKADQADEILRFVDFWQHRTGVLPEELIFDSKLTTYAHLNQLNRLGVQFITLRRRSPQMLEQLYREPASAWRRIALRGLARAYRTPRVLDRPVVLDGYEGPLRQLAVLDLGHEEPTLLLTNQLRRSPATLIGRYAQRMLIENSIADGIDFFHMNALSSAVAMKVNCDLQLTLMASSLYRRLGERIGNGYQHAKSQHLFRDFVEATAQVAIGPDHIDVRFQKRAHNPLLLAAGYQHTNVPVPWLAGKHLRLAFG